MNRLEMMQGIAQQWFTWVVTAGLASTLLLGFVAVLWWGIRRKASAHVGYLLFLVPLVPLILPPTGWIELRIPAAIQPSLFLADGTGDATADPAAVTPEASRSGESKATIVAQHGSISTSPHALANFEEALARRSAAWGAGHVMMTPANGPYPAPCWSSRVQVPSDRRPKLVISVPSVAVDCPLRPWPSMLIPGTPTNRFASFSGVRLPLEAR